MKNFLLIISIILSYSLPAQVNEDSNYLKKFWENKIKPIIENNKETVINYIDFPLLGDWGHLIGKTEPVEQLGESHFREGFEKLFNTDIIRKLKKLNYQNLRSYIDESGKSIISISINSDEFDEHESTLLLIFHKISGEYKLKRIMFAG